MWLSQLVRACVDSWQVSPTVACVATICILIRSRSSSTIMRVTGFISKKIWYFTMSIVDSENDVDPKNVTIYRLFLCTVGTRLPQTSWLPFEKVKTTKTIWVCVFDTILLVLYLLHFLIVTCCKNLMVLCYWQFTCSLSHLWMNE
jgi:hypothetical protein